MNCVQEALIQLEANLKRQLQLIRTATRPQSQQQTAISQSNPSVSSANSAPLDSSQQRRNPTATQLLKEDGWVFPNK